MVIDWDSIKDGIPVKELLELLDDNLQEKLNGENRKYGSLRIFENIDFKLSRQEKLD